LPENEIGEKVVPYNRLFEQNGNLIFKKDLSITIFELLDKILKNENS